MPYSPWITLKKGLYQAVIVGASAGASSLIAFLEALPPEQSAMTFPVLLVLLKMGENWLKHRKE